MNKKQIYIITGIVVLIILGMVGTFFFVNREAQPEEEQEIEENPNKGIRDSLTAPNEDTRSEEEKQEAIDSLTAPAQEDDEGDNDTSSTSSPQRTEEEQKQVESSLSAP